VDASSSGLSPVEGFDISCIVPSSSANAVIVACVDKYIVYGLNTKYLSGKRILLTAVRFFIAEVQIRLILACSQHIAEVQIRLILACSKHIAEVQIRIILT
jgi:hypothetical protein